MRQKTFSSPRINPGPVRTLPVQPRGRRYFWIAVALSAGAHLLATLLVVTLPRVLPKEPRPVEQGTVELLMVEKKGSEKRQPEPTPAQPNTEMPEAPDANAPASAPKAAQAVTAPPGGAEPTAPKAEPAPPHPTETPRQAAAQPVQPEAKAAPVFNLEGTESESNAIALGPQVLPAMQDNRFRNRPPKYPAEAEMHGQHGAVLLVIHVSEDGFASGVDIIQSSGVEILDQAAVAAVRKWRFHPGMREGSAVASEMQFRFVFEPY